MWISLICFNIRNQVPCLKSCRKLKAYKERLRTPALLLPWVLLNPTTSRTATTARNTIADFGVLCCSRLIEICHVLINHLLNTPLPEAVLASGIITFFLLQNHVLSSVNPQISFMPPDLALCTSGLMKITLKAVIKIQISFFLRQLINFPLMKCTSNHCDRLLLSLYPKCKTADIFYQTC